MNNILKTPGLNNPKIFVLTHNRFNTFLVLIFIDLKKAQIYKIPFRNSAHHEIEIIMSSDYLRLFEEDKSFLFEIKDNKYIHVGENVFSFETNNKIEKYFSEIGNNDIKYTLAYCKENIYFMGHQRYIPIEEYKISKIENEYDYLYKKHQETSNDIEGINIIYGNDFINCKIIHSK